MALSPFDRARLSRYAGNIIRGLVSAKTAQGISTNATQEATGIYAQVAHEARRMAGVNPSSVNAAIRAATSAIVSASRMSANPTAAPAGSSLPTIASLYPGTHRYEYALHVQTRDQFGNTVDRRIRITSNAPMSGQEIEDFVHANAVRQASDYGSTRSSLANLGSGAYVSAIHILTAQRTR